jgi:alcohol dehydrogenase, propanol-preferring
MKISSGLLCVSLSSSSFLIHQVPKCKEIYQGKYYGFVFDSAFMKPARIHAYQEPLKVEELPKPSMPHGEEVLVKVGGAGLCHSDLHIIQGEWASSIPVQLPKTLGHEVAGWVEEVGDSVPPASSPGGLVKGDLVVIFGGWGCEDLCAVQKGKRTVVQLCKIPWGDR